MDNALYREEILEHYKNPQNFGKLERFDNSSKQTNPFCGDEIEMFIKFNIPEPAGVIGKHPKGVIVVIVENVKFQGKGCAISMAAASVLTEYVKGKNKKELTKFSNFDMLDLLGVTVSQTRKKCALLARAVLKDCLYGVKNKS